MQDIHTHLYWESYDADRDAVVARAREAGVKEMLVIGCTIDESKQALLVAEKYSEMYAAIGIHPQEYNKRVAVNSQELAEEIRGLRELAKSEKVVAIGECGLEYYSHNPEQSITEEQKEAQRNGFLAQIELAKELKLPMILHCRASTGTADAYEDMFEILRTSNFPLPLVLHCYMGDTEVTKKFLTLPNVYFSFTGNITYPVKKTVVETKDDLTETVKLISLGRIFTETDCPFLTPQAHRGERNEPAYVFEVVAKVAELQGKTAEDVEGAIDINVHKVFNF